MFFISLTVCACKIDDISYSAKFWQGKFWRFWCFPTRPSKFNPSNCLKQYSVYTCMVEDSDYPSNYFPSNIWRVSIYQNFPHQNFALYRRTFRAEHSCVYTRRVHDNLHKHVYMSLHTRPIWFICTLMCIWIISQGWQYKLYEHVLVLRCDCDSHCDIRHRCH